jgi:hypothetical protein
VEIARLDEASCVDLGFRDFLRTTTSGHPLAGTYKDLDNHHL